MGETEKERHSRLSLPRVKREQIKCKTKDCNQPKGHPSINKWIQVNRNQIYSNLFTDYNCMYQDFDMAAGADNIHSQKGCYRTLGGVSHSVYVCVCVLHCVFISFVYMVACPPFVPFTIPPFHLWHPCNLIFVVRYKHEVKSEWKKSQGEVTKWKEERAVTSDLKGQYV